MPFALASLIIILTALTLYTRDLLRGETKPHEFTWLTWAITQGTATAALWVGGGGYAAAPLTATTVFVTVIFCLLLFRGDRNITRSDIVVLSSALLAIVLWWFTGDALLAVVLVTTIDMLGYVPTFRKAYRLPFSEKIRYWLMFCVSDVCALLAIETYTLQTMLYLGAIFTANLLLVLWILWCRQVKP